MNDGMPPRATRSPASAPTAALAASVRATARPAGAAPTRITSASPAATTTRKLEFVSRAWRFLAVRKDGARSSATAQMVTKKARGRRILPGRPTNAAPTERTVFMRRFSIAAPCPGESAPGNDQTSLTVPTFQPILCRDGFTSNRPSRQPPCPRIASCRLSCSRYRASRFRLSPFRRKSP